MHTISNECRSGYFLHSSKPRVWPSLIAQEHAKFKADLVKSVLLTSRQQQHLHFSDLSIGWQSHCRATLGLTSLVCSYSTRASPPPPAPPTMHMPHSAGLGRRLSPSGCTSQSGGWGQSQSIIRRQSLPVQTAGPRPLPPSWLGSCPHLAPPSSLCPPALLSCHQVAQTPQQLQLN